MNYERKGSTQAQWGQTGILVFTTLVMLAGTGCTSGLNTGGTSTAFALVVKQSSDDTKNHPANRSFSISASCGTGQQLVGGGYKLVNNSNANPTLVVIEGSFPSPSASNTWTIQVRNPDNPSLYAGDGDVVILSLAYCLTTPNYGLNTEIVKQDMAVATTANVATEIDVRCSKSSALVLSGGFLTTSLPAFKGNYQAFWPGLLGTGITGSGPRLRDGTHSSMGWHITQQYTPASNATAPQPSVSTTAFALCAQQNINDQAVRVVTSTGVLSAIAPTATLEPLCQQGDFTVGGGYDHVALTLPLGQSGVSTIDGNSAIHAPFAFDGWQISGSSLGSPVDASALCVRIPKI